MRAHTQSTRPRRRTAALRLAALVASGALLLASCSSQAPVVLTVTETPGVTNVTQPAVTVPSASQETSTETSETASSTSTSAAEQPRVSATPAFGSTGVGPTDPVSVMAFHATLSSVTMSGSDGSVVNGEIADGKQWTNTDQLQYGVTYTISGEAVGTDGTSQPFDGTIATVSPKEAALGPSGSSTNAGPDTLLPAYMQIPDGAKVGIAAPIVVTFAAMVQDRAAAEKRMKVTVTDASGNPIEVEGSWGWMQDEDIQGNGVKQSRVHFRPKEYWPANAEVHVELDLLGVDYGSGWGSKNIVRDFTIGEKMVVKADSESHRLLLLVNDEVVKNYPVSYGKESVPGRNTVSGVHIVQDKNDDNPDGSFKMCNLDYGYCNVTEYWGVRINNNGEFIHVNKDTEKKGLLGKANVSHGCINMGMADGKEFYDTVYYGVPVEVTNTGVEMGYGDYVWDWGVSWDTWKTFSAL